MYYNYELIIYITLNVPLSDDEFPSARLHTSVPETLLDSYMLSGAGFAQLQVKVRTNSFERSQFQ